MNVTWRHLAAIGSVCLLSACAQPAPPPAPPLASNPPMMAPGPNATWYHVTFDSNSTEISPAGQMTIGEVVAFMRANPTAEATLIGRTDTVGSGDYNMRLSHKRADAVRDMLVYTNRIPADRVETRWTGETRPRAASADNTAVNANRVVDIAIH